jgi:DNA-binding winged helix-turn-helix (wHTH) protein/F0F1-type ATP synthase membrane subunit c/vacuolar-type H+-ATPase subunit K
MASERFTFGEFTLDPGDRRLLRSGEAVELSSRYLDALTLLLRERGRLVTKDRFMDEVWQGVPVTDEALTQCIKTLRRQLGDDAGRPHFIETVPKHGYRFIAEIVWDEGDDPAAAAPRRPLDWAQVWTSGAAAGAGGAAAGFLGGLFYGLLAAPPAPDAGMGTASILLVLTAVGLALGLAGGAGVGIGIAVSRFVPSDKWQWSAAGGMFGGMLVGAAAKLLAHDSFTLLFGRSPGEVTGPAEGALLGVVIGLAARVAHAHRLDFARSLAVGGIGGGIAGLLIPLLGGHFFGGSLNLLARGFPDARFRLDAVGALLGEQGFGPVSEAVTSTVEGGLFGLCVIGAMTLARRGEKQLKGQ